MEGDARGPTREDRQVDLESDSGADDYSDTLRHTPVSPYWAPGNVLYPEKLPGGERQKREIHMYGVKSNGTTNGHKVSAPARQKRVNPNPLQRKRLIPAQGAIAAAVALDGSACYDETAAALGGLTI